MCLLKYLGLNKKSQVLVIRKTRLYFVVQLISEAYRVDQNMKKSVKHNANRNTGTSSQILLLLSLKPDESLNIKLTK